MMLFVIKEISQTFEVKENKNGTLQNICFLSVQLSNCEFMNQRLKLLLSRKGYAHISFSPLVTFECRFYCISSGTLLRYAKKFRLILQLAR